MLTQHALVSRSSVHARTFKYISWYMCLSIFLASRYLARGRGARLAPPRKGTASGEGFQQRTCARGGAARAGGASTGPWSADEPPVCPCACLWTGTGVRSVRGGWRACQSRLHSSPSASTRTGARVAALPLGLQHLAGAEAGVNLEGGGGGVVRREAGWAQGTRVLGEARGRHAPLSACGR